MYAQTSQRSSVGLPGKRFRIGSQLEDGKPGQCKGQHKPRRKHTGQESAAS